MRNERKRVKTVQSTLHEWYRMSVTNIATVVRQEHPDRNSTSVNARRNDEMQQNHREMQRRRHDHENSR